MQDRYLSLIVIAFILKHETINYMLQQQLYSPCVVFPGTQHAPWRVHELTNSHSFLRFTLLMTGNLLKSEVFVGAPGPRPVIDVRLRRSAGSRLVWQSGSMDFSRSWHGSTGLIAGWSGGYFSTFIPDLKHGHSRSNYAGQTKPLL